MPSSGLPQGTQLAKESRLYQVRSEGRWRLQAGKKQKPEPSPPSLAKLHILSPRSISLGLPSFSSISLVQVIEWLKSTDEGNSALIIFDECHKAKNFQV